MTSYDFRCVLVPLILIISWKLLPYHPSVLAQVQCLYNKRNPQAFFGFTRFISQKSSSVEASTKFKEFVWTQIHGLFIHGDFENPANVIHGLLDASPNGAMNRKVCFDIRKHFVFGDLMHEECVHATRRGSALHTASRQNSATEYESFSLLYLTSDTSKNEEYWTQRVVLPWNLKKFLKLDNDGHYHYQDTMLTLNPTTDLGVVAWINLSQLFLASDQDKSNKLFWTGTKVILCLNNAYLTPGPDGKESGPHAYPCTINYRFMVIRAKEYRNYQNQAHAGTDPFADQVTAPAFEGLFKPGYRSLADARIDTKKAKVLQSFYGQLSPGASRSKIQPIWFRYKKEYSFDAEEIAISIMSLPQKTVVLGKR